MWQPIFTNPKAIEPIKLQVKEIAVTLILNEETFIKNGFGLYSGKSGIEIFFAYLYKFNGNPKYLHHFNLLNADSLNSISNEQLPTPLSVGYTGIAWVFNHLIKQKMWLSDPDQLLGNLDEYIMGASRNYLQANDYDFMHGGLGAAVYFLDRLPNPYAKSCLEEIAKEIKRMAIYDGDNIYWKNIDFITKEPTLNLGLSHGMPSIIYILSLIYKADIACETCKELIVGNIRWMLKQELPGNYVCAYPTQVANNEKVSTSRLSWCYGDLGVALALYHAGNSLDNIDWINHAKRIVLRSTTRTSIEMEGIRDAGLCHGTMSIAHIYNRFYQVTKIEEFKDAAKPWYMETFKFQVYADGLAGFKTYRSEEYGAMQNEPGLLEGVAGIGLGLLAAISDIEPAWDRCLLIS